MPLYDPNISTTANNPTDSNVDVGGVRVSTTNPLPIAQPIIFKSTNNSTTATLAASASFTGTSESILGYQQINIKVFGRPNVAVSGDASDAKGTLFFEFSDDNTNWDISVPIIVRTLGVFIPYPLINVGQYFRVRYLNDGGALGITILGTGETAGTPTNQTVFRLTTYLLPQPTTNLARTLDQGVSGSDPVVLTKSVIAGLSPDRGFDPIKITQYGHLATRDDSSDIFGSLVVGERLNQIEIHFDQAFDASLITNTTASGGTASQANGHALYSTGTSSTASAKGVSTETINYKAGHEIFAVFTAAFTVPIASSYQRIGLYNANNGFFIGYENTTFGLKLRSAGADTVVTSFNGDKLDGGVASQFTRAGVPEAINLAFSNVWRIRLGWLGSAPILYEVLAPDGHWVIVHTIRQPNTQLNPSIASTTLPMTVDVSKTGGSGTSLTVATGSWAGGTTSDLAQIDNSKHLTSSTGIMSLGVRNDTLADLTTADTDYSPISTDSAGRIVNNPYRAVPTSANILSGSRTSNGTIITVPQNRTWVGTIAVSASSAVGANTAQTNSLARVDWNGGSGGTANYTIAQVDLTTAVVLLTALVGSNDSGTMTVQNVIVYAGTTNATLTLTGNTTSQFMGICAGYLV